MKKCFVVGLMLMIFPLTGNCWNADDCKKALNPEIKKVSERISNLESQVRELREVEHQGEGQVKGENFEEQLKSCRWWIWILGALMVCTLLLCSVLVFMTMSSVTARGAMPSKGDNVKRCPRCGWKYTEGETKCRNCGTRF